jgi:hypothetical protein
MILLFLGGSMVPQSLRSLSLNGTVLLDHGTITFLTMRGEPLQEPLLTHFAVTVPDIAALTTLHDAVRTHQRRAELCRWTVILDGRTLRLRGFIQDCDLAYSTGMGGRLRIATLPI